MNSEPSLITLFTTVVWTVVTTAAVAGLRLQYQLAQAPPKQPSPVVAEKMDVQLVGPPADHQPQPDQPHESPAVVPTLPIPDQPPALAPVADPSPTIPFTEAVNQPARLARAGPPVQHLTFGTGEGDKPAPDYPREAKIARQQGTVIVRFTVDENGHVTEAEASRPCPFALLNQAAVRAVRETWDFPPGKPRVYDVTFEFELH